MDWSNERYVRMYTRNTAAWVLWPWQARAVFPLLMRAADRAGVIDASEGLPGVAALILMPLEVVTVAMEALTSGTGSPVSETDHGYVLRNFLEAQEASQSDRQRARESRASRRDRAMRTGGQGERAVTGRDGSDTNRDDGVTKRTETSQVVTSGHSEPSLPIPSLPLPRTEGAGIPIRKAIELGADAIRSKSECALAWRLWIEHCDRFDAMAAELRVNEPTLSRVEHCYGYKQLLARVREFGIDLSGAEQVCHRCMAFREDEAREKRNLSGYGATMWGEGAFAYARDKHASKAQSGGMQPTDYPMVMPWDVPEEAEVA